MLSHLMKTHLKMINLHSSLLFFRRHQGFGVLSVILANHAIKLLTSLFQDLQVEALHRVNKTTKINK